MNDRKIILGIETEYGFIYESRNKEVTSQNIVKNPFIARFGDSDICQKFSFYHQSSGASEWLSNGGRLYYEGSVLPEFNTPECLLVKDLVSYDKAGDKFLFELFQSTKNEGEKVYILKDNRGISIKTDPAFQTIDEDANGCHENYGFYADQLDFDLFFKDTSNAGGSLLSFLVTRQILAGAGFLYCDNYSIKNTPRKNKFFFSISQRSDFIGSLFEQSSNVGIGRPIITKKDEPLAELKDFHRLHLSCGDSNLSEFSTYLKIGTTRLVIRMILEHFIKNYPKLDDPVGDFHRISNDIEYQNKCKVDWPLLLNGSGSVTALEIQNYYCELALDFLAKNGGSEEEWEIAKNWRQTLDLLKTDPDSLNDRLDYRIKLSLFESYLKKYKSSWDKVLTTMVKTKGPKGEILEVPILERLKNVDLSYHDISPRGIYNQLVSKGKIKRILTDDEIDLALFTPPKDTRAYMRGKSLNKFSSEIENCNWQYIYIKDKDKEDSKLKIDLDDLLSGTEDDSAYLISKANTIYELYDLIKIYRNKPQ